MGMCRVANAPRLDIVIKATAGILILIYLEFYRWLDPFLSMTYLSPLMSFGIYTMSWASERGMLNSHDQITFTGN